MLPSSLSVLADAYYVQQAQTARQVANLVQRSFVTIADPTEWWDQHGFDAAQAVRSGQTVAATRSVAYVRLAGELQDAADDYAVEIARLVPPNEVVDGMLLRSLTLAEQAIADGATVAEARTLGLRNIVTLASSMVTDAGQNAAGVAIAASQHLTGYYRQLRLPSCDRCAVMAGRWYEWNEGFQRHPNCDCVHVPVSEAYGSGFDPRRAILSGQVTGLSKADREAIEMGADPSQVINTKGKGQLYPVGGGLQATHSGTTRRGRYGRAAGERTKHAGSRYTRASAPRLTPSSILRMSSSRSDALRLLTRYGYIAA